MKLEVRIREVAESRGVRTAYRLQKLAGLSPSIAARLYRNNVTQISVVTLGKLCEALGCAASDLFVQPMTKLRSTAKKVD
jgi:DNA-binding Xre family transcriptional regulator